VNIVRHTKIVATIGPASRDPETLVRLVEAGMDVARLNFSHGTAAQHAETARRVRQAAGRAGRAVAILQDLPGPKLRIGPLEGDIAELKPTDSLTFCCCEEGLGTAQRMFVARPELVDALSAGDIMYLADGAVRLRVKAVRPGDCEIDAEVEAGGAVASRQGLNIPGPLFQMASVPAEDLVLLAAGERMGVDLVALSFVRSPDDVTLVREHTRLPLIAKIEKPQAVDCAEEIIRAADCVMVARGDLGIELPIERVPIVQKELLACAGRLARPSITATQMLDSMVASTRPTRAEVADVANAILDGTDAVMLSQETAVGHYPVEAVAMMASIAHETETAVGHYPVEAVAMMASIAHETEKAAPYKRWNERRVHRDARDPSYTVAYAVCLAARELELDAIVVPTLSGRSARLVSAHRPTVPIYALSPGRETVRRCGLMWGVRAEFLRRHEVTEELLIDACRRVVELGWVQRGQRVAITAGLPSGVPGSTSLFQVQEL